jgi:hypothetical protein
VLSGDVFLGEGGGFHAIGIPTIGYLPVPQYLCAIAADGEISKLDSKHFYNQVVVAVKCLFAMQEATADQLKGAVSLWRSPALSSVAASGATSSGKYRFMGFSSRLCSRISSPSPKHQRSKAVLLGLELPSLAAKQGVGGAGQHGGKRWSEGQAHGSNTPSRSTSTEASAKILPNFTGLIAKTVIEAVRWFGSSGGVPAIHLSREKCVTGRFI